jgi:hypothetical protein
MAIPTDFQNRRGTVAVTFTQTGTYSTVADMGGMDLVGVYSPAYPAAAGSLTFRASFDPAGTGYPVYTEASVLARVNPFGSGTFYSFTPGSVPVSAPFLIVQVGTAGTTAVAGGGTIILVGRA